MKDAILLIMTPNMSLEKWQSAGFLSRELDFYKKLCEKTGLKLIIFSYGRNDDLVETKSFFELLQMPKWIPSKIPFTLQNLIYHLIAPVLYYKHFKKVSVAKTNQYAASIFGLLLKFTFRIPLVIRMGYYNTHVRKRSKIYMIIERLSFQLGDRLLVTSAEASQFIETQHRISKNKIYTIHNSINLDRFKPVSTLKKIDVLFVGRLESTKNIDLLASFLQETKLNVLVIGNGTLAPLIAAVSKVKHNITWLKRIENKELSYYYNLSKIYLLISKYEGNPKTLLEAMACGLPSVATNVTGIRECINDGVSGVLIEDKLDQLNQSIADLLKDDYRRERMGEAARKWVTNACNMAINTHRESMLFNHLLKREDTVEAVDRVLMDS